MRSIEAYTKSSVQARVVLIGPAIMTASFGLFAAPGPSSILLTTTLLFRIAWRDLTTFRVADTELIALWLLLGLSAIAMGAPLQKLVVTTIGVSALAHLFKVASEQTLGRSAFGSGDVWLLVAAAPLVGFQLWPATLLLACLLSFLYLAARRWITGRSSPHRRVPFAAAYALALFPILFQPMVANS